MKVKDDRFMFRMIRAAFNERRKTLVNALKNDPVTAVPKERTEKALEAMGLPLTVRGEALSLGQFAELADKISLT